MCLDHSAHGVESSHEIFRSPSPVSIRWETAETPKHYRKYWHGRSLGKTMRTWRVQQTGYKDDESMQPGVVSAGWGFDDSPDAEVIAGGINTKGPNSVAIGRHGPFFHWGFSAAPSAMTESGRRAFVNAIHYIHRFDRRAPLVRARSRSRGSRLDGAMFSANLEESHESQVEFYRRQNAERAAAREAKNTRELTDQEKWILSIPERHAPSWEDYRRSHFARYPKDVVAELGTDDVTKYLEYYEKNLEYLVADGRTVNVDPDAEALGISNRSVAILDAAVASMEKNAADARARRILHRYTDKRFATAAAWRAWLDEERDHLFFSDVGGFKFFSARPTVADERRLVLARGGKKPEGVERIVIDLVVLGGEAEPGSTVTVGVRMRIADGWHAYAEVPESSPYPETRLKLALPKGCEAVGDWIKPASVPSHESPDLLTYEGDVVFLRRVRLDRSAAGELPLSVQVDYQVCDEQMCLPPDSVKRAAKITVRSPK